MSEEQAKRTLYLKNISLAEATGKWLETLGERQLLAPGPAETVAIDDSLGRVTATPVFATLSSPHGHCSAMDGYAVRFADTFGASEAKPRRLALGSEALPVDTGDPLPDGFSAVIMIEDVQPTEAGEIEITAAVTPWQHVRTVGEDIVATELILPQNHQIRPVDQAAMLAGGLVEVAVRPRPRVAIIPTGTELVQPGEKMKRGSIIECNSRLLAGAAAGWGAAPARHPVVPDDFEKLKEALSRACAEHDVVVINAGSSAGSEDFTVHVVRELGEVLVHGVRIRPGKPVVLGIVAGTPVLGIPGYPVSAALTFDLFAKPLIYRLQGMAPPERERARVKISRKIPSSIGAEEFVRVKVGQVGERLVAAPIERGAGALMSLARADGILRIPEESEGIKPEDEVDIELLKSLADVKNTIVAVGSHDISLDILASELKRKHPQLTLSSAHVGSIGGLMALKRGEAHLAGIHLLDEETGEYNSSYVRRYLPDTETVLVTLVFREQGLLVAPGNPKTIGGVEDLTRPEIAFINRQRGAGTRILLDYRLKESGIDPDSISGYEREEYTHMAVAAAVLEGSADAGMGIRAAANALGLDFVPVTTERYDLAIPASLYDTPPIAALLDTVHTEAFREKVASLGGYDTSRAGEIAGQNDE